MNRKQVESLLQSGRKGIETWNRQRESGIHVPFLCGINLAGANLFGANLSGLNLTGTNMSEADLSEANLCGSNLFEADLSRADLTGAELCNASLTWVNACGANLFEADLADAELFEADLSWAKLAWADLSMANLSGADLTKADLSNAILTRAMLTRANLTRAKLNQAKLNRVNLIDADLDKADLSGCNLSNANMEGANLSSALLVEANMDNAVISNCRLWQTVRDDWSIRGIRCSAIYWNQPGVVTEYKPGEFERWFGVINSTQIFYPKGISAFEITTLPLLLQELQDRLRCHLHIKSIEQQPDRSVVRISVNTDGPLQAIADEVQKLPRLQRQMDSEEIMRVIHTYVKDQAVVLSKTRAASADEQECDEGEGDDFLSREDIVAIRKNTIPGYARSVTVEHIVNLYEEVDNLRVEEDKLFTRKSKPELLEQLRSLSNEEIRFLDQWSLYVLKSLLVKLSPVSVNTARGILQEGFREKRIEPDRSSRQQQATA